MVRSLADRTFQLRLVDQIEHPPETHSDFRLWIIASTGVDLQLLQSAVIFRQEPPAGLRTVLLHSYEEMEPSWLLQAAPLQQVAERLFEKLDEI